MEKTILIKTSTSNKNLWSKFINANRWQNGIEELVIDFSQCSFIEPFHVVQMACLIEEYHLQNVAVSFVKSDALALNEYLTNIHFFDYWEHGFNRANYQQTGRMTSLCLWKLHSEMLPPYVLYAQRYGETNFTSIPELESVDFQPLNIALTELFNNIVNHSESKVSGFTTCEFYPELKTLKIAVCDFGIGIPTLVNRFLAQNGHNEATDSIIALEKAFQKGFSTKSTPRNKGYGLDTLKTIVKESNGKLNVISNNVMMMVDTSANTQMFTLDHNFQGTLLEIILDTTTFDDLNEGLNEGDFLY